MTLKLYQLGQYIYDFSNFYEIILPIFKVAKEYNVFIWIDTSDRTYYHSKNYLQETYEIYKLLKQDGYDVGFCISSNVTLYTELVESLTEQTTLHHTIRLVKGFYNNYDKDSRHKISKDYLILINTLINCKHISLLAIATHDSLIINHIIESYKNSNLLQKIEFQHFCDIDDNQIIELSKKFHTRVYIPYGKTPLFMVRGMKYFDKWRGFLRIIGLPLYSDGRYHFIEFLKSPLEIGGIGRVGSQSINKILRYIPDNKQIHILEIGGGVGNITKKIIAKSDFPVSVCELHEEFIANLRSIHGTEVYSGYFEDQIFDKKFDVIISTVPMSILSKEKKQIMLSKSYHLLKKNGIYIHLQYSSFIKNEIKKQFGNCITDLCLQDLPFTCTMVAKKE